MRQATKKGADGKAKAPRRFLRYAGGLLTVTVVTADGKTERAAYRVTECGSNVGRGFMVRGADSVEHEVHVGGDGYRCCDCADYQDCCSCVHADAMVAVVSLGIIKGGVPGCVGA